MSTCRVIRSGGGFHGLQGLDYFTGISSETCGSIGICMHLVEFPPGARANAHLHDQHETAIYMLEGTVEMMFGDHLENRLTASAGEFVYIPAGVPHLPYNATDRVARAVLARTDPKEQESVVLRPDLEDLAPQR